MSVASVVTAAGPALIAGEPLNDAGCCACGVATRMTIEGDLVALVDPVQLGPDRSDEGDELVGPSRHERLEVEVHAVGTAVADGRRDLAGQLLARRGTAQQRRLRLGLAGRPGERLDGQDDPGPALVRRPDHRRHPRARPARPADRQRAVAIALPEVAVGIGTDAEVGDRRQELVVQPGRSIGQLPVRQEAEDLAAEIRRGRRGGRVRAGQDQAGRTGRRDGGAGRRVDRMQARPGCLRRQRPACPDRSLAGAGHRPARRRPGRQALRSCAADRPAVVGPRHEREVTRAPGVNAMRSCSWAAASRAMIDGPGSTGWSGTGVRAARRRAAAARVGSVVGSAGAAPAAVEPAPGTDATGLAPSVGPWVGDRSDCQGRRQRQLREHDDREERRSRAFYARPSPSGTAGGDGASVSRARSSVTRSSQRVGQARTVRAPGPCGPSPEGPGPDGYGGVRWARVRFAGGVRSAPRRRTVSAGRASSTTGRCPSMPARRTGRRGCHRSWCRASR